MDEKSVEQEVYGLGNSEPETTPAETEVSSEPEKEETVVTNYGDNEDILDDTPKLVDEEKSIEEKQSEKTSEVPENLKEIQETQEEMSKRFYQHNYQVAMERLKEVDPNFQDWMKDIKEERKQPNKVKSQEEQEPIYVSELTTDELVDMINENVSKASKLAYQDVQSRANYRNELNVAKEVIENFTGENNIPKTEVEEALKYAYQEMGLNDNEPGGPTRVAKVVIDRLRFVGMQKLLTDKMNKTTAETVEKVKMANLVKQPNTVNIPVKADKIKTKEDIILESMRNVGNSKASKEVYGT